MKPDSMTQKGENQSAKAAAISLMNINESTGKAAQSRVFSARLKAREKFKTLHDEKQVSAEA